MALMFDLPPISGQGGTSIPENGTSGGDIGDFVKKFAMGNAQRYLAADLTKRYGGSDAPVPAKIAKSTATPPPSPSSGKSVTLPLVMGVLFALLGWFLFAHSLMAAVIVGVLGAVAAMVFLK